MHSPLLSLLNSCLYSKTPLRSPKQLFLILLKQYCAPWNFVHTMITAFSHLKEIGCKEKKKRCNQSDESTLKAIFAFDSFHFPRTCHIVGIDIGMNEWSSFLSWSWQTKLHVFSFYFYLCAQGLLGIPTVMNLAPVHSFIKIKQASCQTWL